MQIIDFCINYFANKCIEMKLPSLTFPTTRFRVCQSCNSGKGGRRLYEWKGFRAKDEIPRIAEGKYLNLLYDLHNKRGTLNMDKDVLVRFFRNTPSSCRMSSVRNGSRTSSLSNEVHLDLLLERKDQFVLPYICGAIFDWGHAQVCGRVGEEEKVGVFGLREIIKLTHTE
jgi:hypothetical protein